MKNEKLRSFIVSEIEAVLDEYKKNNEKICWKGYEMVGTKMKNGREVPNCVPKNESTYRRNGIGMLNENVAKTILQKLGGRKFITGLGARRLINGVTYITFRFPYTHSPDGQSLNYAKIIFNSMDSYDVELYYVDGKYIKLKHKINDVRASALKRVFIQYTRLV